MDEAEVNFGLQKDIRKLRLGYHKYFEDSRVKNTPSNVAKNDPKFSDKMEFKYVY